MERSDISREPVHDLANVSVVITERTMDARDLMKLNRSRRDVIKATAAAGAGAAGLGFAAAAAQDQTEKTGVDPEEWTPEHINEIAGTYEPDTAAEVAEVTPLDHEGKFDLWYVGPNETTPEVQAEKEAEFWTSWSETYPNIPMEDGDNVLNIGYNDLLDKVRT